MAIVSQLKEITMKYSKLFVAGIVAFALGGCLSLPAGPAGPQGATGNTGRTGDTGASGDTGGTVLIVPAR